MFRCRIKPQKNELVKSLQMQMLKSKMMTPVEGGG
jgi:hypothetical protein